MRPFHSMLRTWTSGTRTTLPLEEGAGCGVCLGDPTGGLDRRDVVRWRARDVDVAEAGEQTLVPARNDMSTVGPRRDDQPSCGTGDPHELVGCRRGVREEVEPVGGVSCSEGAVTEGKPSNVSFDIHRTVAEATTSAPQHPTAEVHSDDERIAPPGPYCPGGEEASPCGNVQDRAFGQDVGQQAGLRGDRSAPHESAREPDVEVIERRNPPAVVGRSASTVGHRLESAGPHPLSGTLRSSPRRLPGSAASCTPPIAQVAEPCECRYCPDCTPVADRRHARGASSSEVGDGVAGRRPWRPQPGLGWGGRME